MLIHLQFTAWPGSSFPASPSQFLQLVSEVFHFWQQQRSKSHPIVVHCLAGAGRTGLFCLLCTALSDLTAGTSKIKEIYIYSYFYKIPSTFLRSRSNRRSPSCSNTLSTSTKHVPWSWTLAFCLPGSTLSRSGFTNEKYFQDDTKILRHNLKLSSNFIKEEFYLELRLCKDLRWENIIPLMILFRRQVLLTLLQVMNLQPQSISFCAVQ